MLDPTRQYAQYGMTKPQSDYDSETQQFIFVTVEFVTVSKVTLTEVSTGSAVLQKDTKTQSNRVGSST